MSFVRPVLSLTLLALTALGLHNVYADNTAVMDLAKGAACDACQATISQVGKSPINHTYIFATGSGTATVKCQRTYIFVGAYSCEKQSD